MKQSLKKVQIDKNRWLVSTDKYHGWVDAQWFEPQALEDEGSIIGTSVGRSTTYFFEKDKKKFVLRRYFRGGLLAKVNRDKYLFSDFKKTRGYRELDMLRKMRELNLPVPKPVAMLLEKKGLSYSASIIIRLIKHSQDLFHYLQEQPLTAEQWTEVGQMIRKFHDEGVYHSDLNIHNILLTKKDKFWLIDFDKCDFVKPNAKKLEGNLERLLRSLRKEKLRCDVFNWEESYWDSLLDGYKNMPTD